MGKTVEGLVDATYGRVAGQHVTKFIGTMGVSELSPRRLLGSAESAVTVLSRGTLDMAKTSGSGLLRAAGIRLAVAPDLSRPEQQLEYREHLITANRHFIMSGEKGIVLGTYLFDPWAEAAWATDALKQTTTAPKPPALLAEDYFYTMDQRGVTDTSVREEITERVLETLPTNVLDIDDAELMKLTDLHSMTHLPRGG